MLRTRRQGVCLARVLSHAVLSQAQGVVECLYANSAGGSSLHSGLDWDNRKLRGCMHLTVEVEREDDGRWLAEVPDLAGVLAYGQTREEAVARAEALALRVLADRLDHGEAGPDLVSVSFQAA